MSQDNVSGAEAINLAEVAAHPTEAIIALVKTVERQERLIESLTIDFERFKKTHSAFAIRTTNDIDEIFAKVDTIEGKQPKNRLLADRAEVLRALVAANGGKMIAKDARRKMGLGESTFSRLLANMNEWIEVKPMKSNRGYLLTLRSKIT